MLTSDLKVVGQIAAGTVGASVPVTVCMKLLLHWSFVKYANQGCEGSHKVHRIALILKGKERNFSSISSSFLVFKELL